MENAFKVGVLLGIFAIAVSLFLSSQNGRYQYSINESRGIIVDTRTGQFWTEEGSHFQPRVAQITMHQPLVNDETASDERSQRFHDCLQANIQALRNHSPKRDCVAEQNFAKPEEHAAH